MLLIPLDASGGKLAQAVQYGTQAAQYGAHLCRLFTRQPGAAQLPFFVVIIMVPGAPVSISSVRGATKPGS